MFCSSCGKAIPEVSIFCMFCGSNIAAPQQKTAPLAKIFSNKIPNIIDTLGFYFVGPILKKEGNKISRNCILTVSLLDNENNQTAFPGYLELKHEIRQHAAEYDPFTNLGSTKLSSGKIKKEIKESDFIKTQSGNLLIIYKFESHIWVRLTGDSRSGYPTAKIEVQFVPSGSKQPLYKIQQVAADAQVMMKNYLDDNFPFSFNK